MANPPVNTAWVLAPKPPSSTQLEQAASNLADEFGAEFVLANKMFALAVYDEMLAAAPSQSPSDIGIAAIVKAAVADADAVARVVRVECVSFENGYEEPTDPVWRIELEGICADFETETAAQNFADAINRRAMGILK